MEHDSINNFMGYPVSNRGLNGDVDIALSFVENGRPKVFMACANPHSLVIASKDEQFRESLRAADILVPDGIGIILGARVLGLPIRQKVAGFDFFHRFSEKAQEKGGIRYFFLGSSPAVLKLIEERLKADFPGIHLCGMYSPPFKGTFTEEEDAEMIEAINSAKPDVVWIGMTAPKQEKWIYKNRSRVEAPLMAAVGAVFDFYAGTKKRSSNFWISLGLEWLPRLVKEPKRLWERNIKSTPIFLWYILLERVKRTYKKHA